MPCGRNIHYNEIFSEKMENFVPLGGRARYDNAAYGMFATSFAIINKMEAALRPRLAAYRVGGKHLQQLASP
jgi:hypothetical protein